MSPHRKVVVDASAAPAASSKTVAPTKKPSKRRKTAPANQQPAARSPEANEVREEKVKRAKRLLQDANYPSDEVIESVANLLARGWRKTQSGLGGASIEGRDPGTN